VQIQYPEQEEIAALPPLDISTIEKALGFTPQFELAKGLADYVTEAGFR
jgi:nucleoside-diphosphate-sugar epimerase